MPIKSYTNSTSGSRNVIEPYYDTLKKSPILQGIQFSLE
jgi:hypothetical protein